MLAALTLTGLLGYPFPAALAGNDRGTAIAYALVTRGVRTLWFARAPEYAPQQLFSSGGDDGQELSDLVVSNDGAHVVYVRGGDHDANWPEPLQPNAASSTTQPQMQVWSAATAGGAPKLIGEGDAPAISPDGSRVAYTNGGAVMVAPSDASAAPKRLFFDSGQDSDLQWSPSGTALVFVSARTDHSFIGVYRNDAGALSFIAPTTSQDFMPRWSPDGAQIAFLRLHGDGGPPRDPLTWNPVPWEIWDAHASGGAAHLVWSSPNTPRGTLPQSAGGPFLEWAAGNNLVFKSSQENWLHLYSVAASGGAARLLTPGAFMVEDVAMSPDRAAVFYSANTGSTAGDDDRRHIFRADVASGSVTQLTHGASSETNPVPLENGAFAFNRATAQQPLLVTLQTGDAQRALDANLVASDFPASELITPREVSFRAPDGLLIHGQLFEPAGGGKHPGVIFVHGGPPRQMMLTWHYMDYYSNAYAVNQALASRGFVVLSVNYRLGIGYGHDFNYPVRWGPTGASEYQDVLAGARFLQKQPSVDSNRIGIWGGSYGGYLTALALARNSNVFKAGVDFHGVHDWSLDIDNPVWGFTQLKRYQRYNTKALMKVAWESSPDSAIATWKSPVLLIQGDDDRNVEFHQMVDLVERLRVAGVPYEQIVIPNEIHGFFRYQAWLTADTATVEYLTRKLHPTP